MLTTPPDQDEFLDHQLFEEFVIPCEIPSIVTDPDGGWCKGPNPAEWIGYRKRPCSCGLLVRLCCTQCKDEYIRRMAHLSHFACPKCDEETGGFSRFEPLRQAS